jgi:hypothetical protein
VPYSRDVDDLGKPHLRAYARCVGKKAKKRMPKKKCCVSSTRCKRCPIRMLKEGTLPDGYTVKKRRLVKAA